MSLPSITYARNARRQFIHALSTRNQHDLLGPVNSTFTYQCDLATASMKNRAFYFIRQGIVAVERQYRLDEIEQRRHRDPAPSGGPSRRGNEAADEHDSADEDQNLAGSQLEGEERQQAEEVVGRIDKTAEGAARVPLFGHNLHVSLDPGDVTGNVEDPEEHDPPATGPSESESDVPTPPRPGRPSAASNASHTSVITTTSSTSGTKTTVTTISNGSKRVAEFTEYPDFRLDMGLINKKDDEIGRHTIAIVQIKMAPPLQDEAQDSARRTEDSVVSIAGSVADQMLPKAIQAVQVAFAKDPEIDEIVDILVVDEFCRFLYFRREDVLGLDPFSGRRVAEDPPATGKKLWAKLKRIPYRCSSMLQIVHGVRVNGVAAEFGGAFVGEFAEFVDWAKRR